MQTFNVQTCHLATGGTDARLIRLFVAHSLTAALWNVGTQNVGNNRPLRSCVTERGLQRNCARAPSAAPAMGASRPQGSGTWERGTTWKRGTWNVQRANVQRANVPSRDGRGRRAPHSCIRCPFVDRGVIPIGIEQAVCAISPARTVMPSQQSPIQNLQSKMASVGHCAVIAAARRCITLHPPANIAATECQRRQKRDQNENNERLTPANGHDVAF